MPDLGTTIIFTHSTKCWAFRPSLSLSFHGLYSSFLVLQEPISVLDLCHVHCRINIEHQVVNAVNVILLLATAYSLNDFALFIWLFFSVEDCR